MRIRYLPQEKLHSEKLVLKRSKICSGWKIALANLLLPLLFSLLLSLQGGRLKQVKASFCGCHSPFIKYWLLILNYLIQTRRGNFRVSLLLSFLLVFFFSGNLCFQLVNHGSLDREYF